VEETDIEGDFIAVVPELNITEIARDN